MNISMNLFLLSAIVCVVTWVLFVPFINLLYRLNMQDPTREKGRLDKFGNVIKIFDQIKAGKTGTPIGGGILVMVVALLVFTLLRAFGIYEMHTGTYLLLVVASIAFSIIGLYDDLIKIFKFRGLDLRVRHKFLVQFSAAALISYFGINSGLFHVYIPFVDATVTNIYVLYAISILTITFMSNAFNIIDGIDGLSSGSLLISLMIFAALISHTSNNLTELIFVFTLFGSVLAYLYFNINPARLFMGDTGALAFGALLGVFTMTTGTLVLLPFMGFIYIGDALSSLLQWGSMYLRNGKRIFKIAPLHHHFEAMGWEGTKVVFRFWVVHVFFGLLTLGLFFVGW